MKHYYSTLLSFAACTLLLGGCMTTATGTRDFLPSQPQDLNMNCQQLSEEISYLDNFIYQTEKSLAMSGYGSNSALKSSAQRAARDVTENDYSGYIGDLGNMARDWERQQAQTQQFNLNKAQQRRNNLAVIGQNKNCTNILPN